MSARSTNVDLNKCLDKARKSLTLIELAYHEATFPDNPNYNLIENLEQDLEISILQIRAIRRWEQMNTTVIPSIP